MNKHDRIAKVLREGEANGDGWSLELNTSSGRTVYAVAVELKIIDEVEQDQLSLMFLKMMAGLQLTSEPLVHLKLLKAHIPQSDFHLKT